MLDPSNVFHILDDDFVTLTKMNNIVEVQYIRRKNNRVNIKRLNDDEYLILSTGEIKKYKDSKTRFDSKNSLRQTFKKLRYLINNNFLGCRNELFITLTYAENMRDVKRLYEDVKNFIKRLRYHYKDISNIEYLNVVEPQGRGAWHCHILVKFIDLNGVYIENSLLSDIWGHGFVNVRSISNMSVDNIGAYLTAYLADMPIDEVSEKDLKESFGIKDVKGKKYVKGGRMNLYPKGMNIFRKSRGIKYPERQVMKFKDIKKYVGDSIPTYFSKNDIVIDDFDNTIIYYQYNLSRES